MHYEVLGQDNPVVLIHHLGGNLNSWRFQIPELSKYFKVVAYDLRGHGYSECPLDGYSLNDQTEDLVELAGHLGLPGFHAIGHSIGGSIALNAAIQYPDILDQVVAVAPPIEPTPEARLKESGLLLKTAKTRGMEAVAEARRETMPKKITENEELWREFKRRYGMTSVSGFEKTVEALTDMPSMIEELPKIRNHVLGIAGDLDVLSPNLDIMASKIPNFRKLAIPGCGHFPMLENTAEFNRSLFDFFL